MNFDIIPANYNFETYEGDDDFLIQEILKLDGASELLLGRSIPELWRIINTAYIETRSQNVKTVVVNKYAEPFDVDIMRPTIWGNPFRIGEDGTREEVIQKYRERLEGLPHLIELAKQRLRGKRLGCCCKPQPCHGDVLVKLIEEGESGDKG